MLRVSGHFNEIVFLCVSVPVCGKKKTKRSYKVSYLKAKCYVISSWFKKNTTADESLCNETPACSPREVMF